MLVEVRAVVTRGLGEGQFLGGRSRRVSLIPDLGVDM